ncbi:MAG: Asp-tRNA(Asn)/Glu-tRNA(Gln) amidotransferase subunit GatC [Deinococcales bacterium]
MSTVLPEEIEHLKKLARLEMSAEETAAAAADINSILQSFETLQSLDLSSYPEMPRPIPMVNVMREDIATPALEQAVALSVAIEAEDGFFKVPRTVES